MGYAGTPCPAVAREFTWPVSLYSWSNEGASAMPAPSPRRTTALSFLFSLGYLAVFHRVGGGLFAANLRFDDHPEEVPAERPLPGRVGGIGLGVSRRSRPWAPAPGATGLWYGLNATRTGTGTRQGGVAEKLGSYGVMSVRRQTRLRLPSPALAWATQLSLALLVAGRSPLRDLAARSWPWLAAWP